MSGYPPAGAPPPAAPGKPGSYPPPGQPGYPPPGQPGSYPPPGQPGSYPPPGQPGGYPPPGQPGTYPPPGQPGYPAPPPGSYPPAAFPGGAAPPGQFPPGQFPPAGYGYGQPPLGYPAQPPPGAMHPGMPPHGAPPHGAPHPGYGYQPPPGGPPPGQQGFGHDGDDSSPELEGFASKNEKYPVKVRFYNKTGRKVKLVWLNYDGDAKKCATVKDGKSELIDTYETHPWFADDKKGKCLIIEKNIVFFPKSHPGMHGEIKAEIKRGPEKVKNLKSEQGGHPVVVKFCNRSRRTAVIKWIDFQGKQQKLKEISPRKTWTMNSFEGHYFIANVREHDGDELDLNYGWFYTPTRGRSDDVEKIYITVPDDSSSSGSSSD